MKYDNFVKLQPTLLLYNNIIFKSLSTDKVSENLVFSNGFAVILVTYVYIAYYTKHTLNNTVYRYLEWKINCRMLFGIK